MACLIPYAPPLPCMFMKLFDDNHLRNEITTVIPAKAGIHLEATGLLQDGSPKRRYRFVDDNVQ
jgi:hypothetical protein